MMVILVILTMSVTNTAFQIEYYVVKANEEWSCDIKEPYPLNVRVCIIVTGWSYFK